MRSRRRLALAACTALALASLTSGVLVSGAGAKQATTSAARIKIGYINLSNALPFVVIVRKSIEAAAKANGAQLVECDSNENAQQAINCAAEFKSEHVQGIANFQLDATAAPRVCAAGPKVPVVAIDIPQPPCQTMFFGANNVYAGKLAGVALGKFAKKAWGCKADAVLSLNDLAAGSVVIQRENGSSSAGLPRSARDSRSSTLPPMPRTRDRSRLSRTRCRRCRVLTICSSLPPTTIRRTAPSRRLSPPAGSTTSTSAHRAATRRRGLHSVGRPRSSTGRLTRRTSRSATARRSCRR